MILLYFLLIQFVYTSNIYTQSYTIPDTYILDKSVYGNAKNIIVEMWGAGGASGRYYGGGSGAYIKINLPTIMNDKNIIYELNIGKGGYYITNNQSYYCISGNDTTIINKEYNILLIAGGGNSGCSYEIYNYQTQLCTNNTYEGIGGNYFISKHITNYLALDGINATKTNTYFYGKYYTYYGNGGNAQFGGIGGLQIANTYVTPQNGSFPGG